MSHERLPSSPIRIYFSAFLCPGLGSLSLSLSESTDSCDSSTEVSSLLGEAGGLGRRSWQPLGSHFLGAAGPEVTCDGPATSCRIVVASLTSTSLYHPTSCLPFIFSIKYSLPWNPKSHSLSLNIDFILLIKNFFIWLSWVLVLALWIFSCKMWAFSCGIWDLVPWPGIKPRALHWEGEVLATGLPLLLVAQSCLTLWPCGL